MNDEQNEPIEEYAPTAYRSDQIPEQEAAPEGIDKGFSVKARLPWGKYLNINPSLLEFEENWYKLYKKAGEEEYRKYSSISHRRNSYGLGEISKGGKGCLQFALVAAASFFSFYKGGGIVVCGILIIPSAFMYLFSFDFLNSFKPFFTGLIISLLATAFRVFFEKHEVDNYKKSTYADNERAFFRETGVITTFQGALLFYEFDPVLEASYSNTGGGQSFVESSVSIS